MNPRVKDAVLWGVVGFLTFLVLLQGYELLENLRVDLAVKAGAAVVVFVATTIITYVANGRMGAPVEQTDAARDSTPIVGEPENGVDSVSDGSAGDGNGDEADSEEADEGATGERGE